MLRPGCSQPQVFEFHARRRSTRLLALLFGAATGKERLQVLLTDADGPASAADTVAREFARFDEGVDRALGDVQAGLHIGDFQ